MCKFVSVIIPIPVNRGFIYTVPEDLKSFICPGVQVIVPFGKRSVSGIVLEIYQTKPDPANDTEIRSISELVFPEPIIERELMVLLKWISEYYMCSLGEAYRLVHAGINVSESRLFIHRLPTKTGLNLTQIEQEILDQIPEGQEVSFYRLSKKVNVLSLSGILMKMEGKGIIERRYSEVKKKKILKTEDYFRLNPNLMQEINLADKYKRIKTGRTTKAKKVLTYLDGRDWTEFNELATAGFSRNVINRLYTSGILQKESRPLSRSFQSGYREIITKIILTDEQRSFINHVIENINKNQFRTFLLHGITGSGKTQIYIELIRYCINNGNQAIVLIPEIVLTPQTLARFGHYFGETVGVLHSRLSAGEKREVLVKVRTGEIKVIIGARSAVFAPVKKLGLIIVDEEHETSYKQSDAQPRYHARDVAVYRAKLNNATVILGSATPSFESLYNVKNGDYGYFQVKKRIETRSLPRISIVNVKEEWKKNNEIPVVTENLELKIESRLLTHEQIIILQNRRGYAPYILCKDCGFIAKCPNCDITLTFHRKNRKLRCHYCVHCEEAPDTCPECNGMDILYKGIGTQQLEEVLREKFGNADILRMDQDTTRGKHSHMELLEKFRSGKSDILLGTKMISKGLDFKKVTLVGVVSADQGLQFPDFRSAEKVFQLLTQTAGRAGRGASSGEVVIQTFDPAHYMYKYLLTHDYEHFFLKEIENRRQLKYPPFSRLLLIRIEGHRLKEVERYSKYLVKFLWSANRKKFFSILGPVASPISRIRNVYRYQILIKQDKKTDPSMSKVRKIVKDGILSNPEVKKWPVKLIIDIDPVDIL